MVAAGVQRQVEKLSGVERAEVDWKDKLAEVFATDEGFDPGELPEAVRRAGFVPPDSHVGIDVSAVGTVEVDGEALVLALPEARWTVTGEALDDLRQLEGSTAVRLRGAFRPREGDRSPILEATSWEVVRGDD